MSKTLDFKIFCFEAYKAHHKMKGRDAMDLFKKYNVFEYLTSCYDVLHTTGREYIIEEIDNTSMPGRKLRDVNGL